MFGVFIECGFFFQVKVWFQNRRTKFKRLRIEEGGYTENGEMNSEPVSSPEHTAGETSNEVSGRNHQSKAEELQNLSTDRLIQQHDHAETRDAQFLLKSPSRGSGSWIPPNQPQFKMPDFLPERSDTLWQRYLHMTRQIDSIGSFPCFAESNLC